MVTGYLRPATRLTGPAVFVDAEWSVQLLINCAPLTQSRTPSSAIVWNTYVPVAGASTKPVQRAENELVVTLVPGLPVPQLKSTASTRVMRTVPVIVLLL